MKFGEKGLTLKLVALRLFVAQVLCASGLILNVWCVDAANAAISVTSTGYDIASTDPYIAWIDNNQVLFVGKKSNPDPKKGSFLTGKTYLWNESAKSVREYSEATNFCFADGIINYSVQKYDESGRTITLRYAGPIGAPVLVKESTASSIGPRNFSRFSCKLLEEFAPSLPKTRMNLALREGDGYLVLQPNDHKEYVTYPRNIVLYREKDGTLVTLPITWDEDVGIWDAFYSVYLNAYVLHPQKFISGKRAGEWPVNEPRVVYVMYAASGKVERIVFPKADGFYRPRPIQGGWIYGGGSFYKSAGLYIYKTSLSSKLDAGNIHQIAISPDGCKAAVAINNWHLEMGTPTTIKIFNFCL